MTLVEKWPQVRDHDERPVLELVLDGTTYRGTSRWPEDEVKGLAPYSRLTFDPPLSTGSP